MSVRKDEDENLVCTKQVDLGQIDNLRDKEGEVSSVSL